MYNVYQMIDHCIGLRENIITFVLSVRVVHLGEDHLPFKNNTSWGKIIPKGKK